MDIMRDPATANCRIYIGNLPEFCRKEIEEYFSKYGNILGTVLNRGFGFVQYENPESAMEAIKNENNNIFMNRKIIVRNVNDKQGGGGDNAKNRNNRRGGGGNMGNKNNMGNIGNMDKNQGGPNSWNMRERSPIDTHDRDRGMNMGSGSSGVMGIDRSGMMGNDRVGGGNNMMGSDRGGPGSGGGVGMMNFDRGNNMMGGNENMLRGGMGGNIMHSDNRNTNMPGRGAPSNFDNRMGSGGFGGPAPNEKNDCEIIVVSKALTEYAEMVEAYLKRRGLTVDLLFPNDDVPIGKVLANISSKGTLYAILVTPQNEEHRSITVNILYGTPTEHRNMPVEDAINFIYSNYQQKIKCDREGIPVPPAVQIAQGSNTVPPLSERHPDSIQILINLLANNRSLTVLQYDRVIKYLEDRRELQKKVEIGDDDDFPRSTIRSGPDPEEELQKKILSILNKPSLVNNPIEQPPSINSFNNSLQSLRSAPSSSNSSTLLHDPKVQRALDSLLQGNLMSGYK